MNQRKILLKLIQIGIDHLYQDLHEEDVKLFLHYSDLTDDNSLRDLIKKIRPSEIYNLGAQSHVSVSFELPEYTADVDALGTLRILECIRELKLEDVTKFYQASSSELYVPYAETPQNENTKFYPKGPYAVARVCLLDMY